MTDIRKVGQVLKTARKQHQMTQEQVADLIQVSRQTISNWENDKSYPDIVSLIKLSDLYQISLDQLVKGDQKMVEHLIKSTDAVTSNRKLILAASLNLVLLLIFILASQYISANTYLVFACALFGLASCVFLFFQIINRI